MMKKAVKGNKGLTLVEWLAVIVILGIIAAIAVPAIGGTIKKSKENADIATLLLIEDAAIRYAMTENLTTTTTRTVAQLVTDGYLTGKTSWALQSNSAITFTNAVITVNNQSYSVVVNDGTTAIDETRIKS